MSRAETNRKRRQSNSQTQARRSMRLLPIFRFAATVSLSAAVVSSFSPRHTSSGESRSYYGVRPRTHSRCATSLSASLVVVSPPGGVGEVAAMKAAEMGCSVHWFVVSQPVADEDGSQPQGVVAKLQLSPEAVQKLQTAGGALELAGSPAGNLLLSSDDPRSTLASVSQWTGTADAVICTYDRGPQADQRAPSKEREIEEQKIWDDAIKVAACEAARCLEPTGKSVAILSAFDEDRLIDGATGESAEGIAGLVTGLFNGMGKPTIPKTLSEALQSNSRSDFHRIRYGNLFGMPESSPDFSPLIGGPRKDAELCEEYSMRAVRVDPSLSMSGNIMVGSTTRSSRLAVGEAAVLVALGKVPVASETDVCISSQRGLEPMSTEEWKEEFLRVEQVMSSGQGARLFTADFASVPNTSRFADWLATKWAPAILRTYEIATIRSGERPVYVSRAGDDMIEIIWQKLVDFQSATVGKMIIQVNDDGLVAFRGSGDASNGFGSISSRPLNGEDVIVRFLAEAAAQAVEKGLAKKAKMKATVRKAQPEVATRAPVTSLQSAGTVVASQSPPVAQSARSDQGPRTTGARRSTERQRGREKRSEENNES